MTSIARVNGVLFAERYLTRLPISRRIAEKQNRRIKQFDRDNGASFLRVPHLFVKKDYLFIWITLAGGNPLKYVLEAIE
jgi:hypothetical protein